MRESNQYTYMSYNLVCKTKPEYVVLFTIRFGKENQTELVQKFVKIELNR